MVDKIYPEHKKWLFVAPLIVMCFLYFVVFYFDFFPQKNVDAFVSSFASNVITFESIYFGFYFTSMSILFSSKYITHLNEVDDKKPTQRKIHTFKAYFYFAISFALITIIVAFILLVSIEVDLLWIKIIFPPLVCLIILNLFFAFLILKVFFNALIVQARSE